MQRFRDKSAVGLYIKACSQAQRQDRDTLAAFERVRAEVFAEGCCCLGSGKDRGRTHRS
jgi:hypothetical protein